MWNYAGLPCALRQCRPLVARTARCKAGGINRPGCALIAQVVDVGYGTAALSCSLRGFGMIQRAP
jgi:hypothetical protein